jgi:murein tripeptide amidase MpaA
MLAKGNWRVWLAGSTVLLGLVVISPSAAQPVRYDGHQVVRVQVSTRQDLDLLLSMTDDLWSESVGIGPLDVRVSPEQFDRLRQSGLKFQVLIPDVQALIDQQFAEPGTVRDAFDNYMNLTQVYDYLNTLVSLQPTLASTFVAGRSIQNRDIKGIAIRAPGTGRRPGVLFHGGQHAREWITVPVALYVADQLIRRYGTDPYITSLVNRFEWYIIPVMNPDGYVYTWNTDRLWRKNRRNNGGGIYGVDLNRNWGVGWGGPGSSGTPSDETYRGTAPFSEPETRAIRDFILNHPDIVAYCDLHSYSQLIMYPYAYRDASPYQPDRAVYEYLAQRMSQIVESIHGLFYNYGPVYTTIYPAAGASVDWVYDVGGAFAFTYELRDTGQYGFILPASQIRPNCEEVFPALLFFADYLFADCNANGIWDPQDLDAGTSQDCNANGVPDECEPGGTTDCNNNGWIDLCEIYSGISPDCNENRVPDDCDIAAGTSQDCQPNGIPDECDLLPPSTAQAQDFCANAQIVCPPGTYVGTTVGATNDGAASCGLSGTTADVWYYYRPYGSGLLEVSLCGSAYDTVLSVHTGCPGLPSNQLACSDDDPACGNQSRLIVPVQHGQEYWIRISGHGGAVGSFTLSVVGPACNFSRECNDNGIPDECEPDCNANGQPDDCDIASGFSPDANANGIPDECEGQTQPGDLNCDGLINTFDIDPFVLALSNPTGYEQQYPNCDYMLADINNDGQVNAFDIDPFVELLTGR